MPDEKSISSPTRSVESNRSLTERSTRRIPVVNRLYNQQSDTDSTSRSRSDVHSELGTSSPSQSRRQSASITNESNMRLPGEFDDSIDTDTMTQQIESDQSSVSPQANQAYYTRPRGISAELTSPETPLQESSTRQCDDPSRGNEKVDRPTNRQLHVVVPLMDEAFPGQLHIINPNPMPESNEIPTNEPAIIVSENNPPIVSGNSGNVQVIHQFQPRQSCKCTMKTCLIGAAALVLVAAVVAGLYYSLRNSSSNPETSVETTTPSPGNVTKVLEAFAIDDEDV